MYDPAKPAAAAAEPAGVAPVTGVPVGPPGGGATTWSSGLFDCFSDPALCCLTCWCPCITFGRVAEIVDRGSSSCGTSGALYALLLTLTGCQWIYSCTYRSKMRAQYNLPDSACADCCVHFWCEPCALCQQYKELKARGYNPDLGWHLNAERRGDAAATVYAPPTQEMGR